MATPQWKPSRTMAECDAIMCAPGAVWEYETKEIGTRGPMKVFKNQVDSLRDFWEGSRIFGEKDYIIYLNERLTYEQTHVKVEIMARLLQSYGVKKGDRVAIVMRNIPEWIVSFYAIQSLGAVAACVNAWLLPEALSYCINHSGCKILIQDLERANILAPRMNELKKGGVEKFLIARGIVDGMLSLEKELLTPHGPVKRVEIYPEDNACIFFTSGTTGLPKGVLSTQRQYLTNYLLTRVASSRNILRNGQDLPIPDPNLPQKGVLLTVPLFHVTGNQSLLALPTGTGAKLVLLHKWNLKDAVDAINTEKLTVAGGVPFQVLALIESGLGQNSTLEGFTFGGAPSPENLPLSLQKNMGSAIAATTAYGLTETNSIITSQSGEDYLNRPGSCGLPTMINEFKIVDMETGKSLPAKSVGEITVRGANVALGYWNNEKATNESFDKDGWFRSGDLGYLDEEGWLFIVDRAKEIIIRGGENISTISVENTLYEDERVESAAVVPVKDYMLGELVTAMITIKPFHKKNPPTEKSLIALVSKLLPKHCVPIMIVVVEELPRNATGKIEKKKIKEMMNSIWEEKLKKQKVAAKL